MWGALRSYIANSRRRLQNFLADDPTIGISMEREQEREAMLGECREHVREIKAILQGDADLQTKESAVYKIVVLCRCAARGGGARGTDDDSLSARYCPPRALCGACSDELVICEEMRELSSDRPSGSYQETFVQALYRSASSLGLFARHITLCSTCVRRMPHRKSCRDTRCENTGHCIAHGTAERAGRAQVFLNCAFLAARFSELVRCPFHPAPKRAVPRRRLS
eukprot:3158587-Rhodomonas_salina.2